MSSVVRALRNRLAERHIPRSNFMFKDGYVARTKPSYFDDVGAEALGIVHQPDVYPFAAHVARLHGCSNLVDLGCGQAEKFSTLSAEFRLVGVDHGPMWSAQVASAKWHAVEAAKRIVDRALDVTGGGGMFKGNELERLYRDVRCGGFHPMNDALTHEVVAKTVLAIDPAGPRW